MKGENVNNKQRELLKAIIRDHTFRTTKTPTIARESLVAEGVITTDGKLTKGYGGANESLEARDAG